MGSSNFIVPSGECQVVIMPELILQYPTVNLNLKFKSLYVFYQEQSSGERALMNIQSIEST